MQIWVDADACPGAVKQILFRAADRLNVRVTLVANKLLSTPRSPNIRAIQVARGFDVADRRIAESMQPGDLVVTADRLPRDRPSSATQVRQQILLQKVLYWNPRLDITSAVVERLNKRYQDRPQRQTPRGARATPPVAGDGSGRAPSDHAPSP